MDEQSQPQDSQPASGQDPYRAPYRHEPGPQDDPGTQHEPRRQADPGYRSSGYEPGYGYSGYGYSGYGQGNRGALRRRRAGRVAAGVAGGIADYLDLDPTVVRVGFAALTVFAGVGLPAYVACWLLIPEEGADTAVADGLLDEIGDWFSDAEARLEGRTR